MTTYRIMDGLSGRPGNGPSTATSLTGNYMAGLMFEVTQPGMFFNGYYLWVCNTGQSTAPVQCALWNASSSSGGILVPGTTITSGTLTAGQWNFIPLATPIPISTTTPYCTAVSINGNFPLTQHQFGTGDTYHNGIVNGPLSAFSDSGSTGSTLPAPYSLHQMPFSVAASNPTTQMPTVNDLNDNLWVDVQVSDVTPGNYAGTYRLFPNKLDASPTTGIDTNEPFNLANEIHIGTPCTLSWFWFYSIAGAASLPTAATIYRISNQSVVAQNASPTWLKPDGSAASAGVGWIKCAISGTLTPDAYKVAIYNSAGGAGGWSPREFGYWLTGAGASGLSWGPISAPSQGNAANAYIFQPNGSSTPPWTDGHSQEPQNGTFAHDSLIYPYLGVDFNFSSGAPPGAIAENFWTDIEVTPIPVAVSDVAGATDSVSVSFAIFVSDVAGAIDSASSVITGQDVFVNDVGASIDSAVKAIQIIVQDFAGGVESYAETADVQVAELAGGSMSFSASTLSATVFSVIIVANAFTSLNSSFTSSCVAGQPIQGNMRQLALGRWNYMYPS